MSTRMRFIWSASACRRDLCDLCELRSNLNRAAGIDTPPCIHVQISGRYVSKAPYLPVCLEPEAITVHEDNVARSAAVLQHAGQIPLPGAKFHIDLLFNVLQCFMASKQ